MSLFDSVPLAPADPILGITEAYKDDPNPNKVNLGVGVYLDADGLVPILQCVQEAEKRLTAEPRPRTYLPISGLPSFVEQVNSLVFGVDSPHLERVATVQSLSGTGALKIGADFVKRFYPAAQVLISNPSWENHRALFERAGLVVNSYRYYDSETRGLDAEGLYEDLNNAKPGTVVVLHACCHNPTGVDLDTEQWAEVAAIIGERELIPFLDMAYQGFSQGVERDSAVVRAFAAIGVPVFVASSLSKNFSLYGERVGALSVVTFSADEAQRVLSQLKVCIRTNYSNPPTHGAAVGSLILGDPLLRASWEAELEQMRLRTRSMRLRLTELLRQAGSAFDPSFISDQVGLFSFTGLTPAQMSELRENWSVYGTQAGRICVAALNEKNIERVVEAIVAVSR
ncbi:MAG: aspartate/tyrosine/aromatic aminotransferase [Propionibacteriaceae bacterium]|jgi:aromatic-amino-acid transaminase|nr:aspartate/tyrosine/aromatic aminotransferase [Propionibacteriaceae bacterium]